MGSGYIFALVGGKYLKKKSSIDPYQRIMAMYSVYDIMFSFFFYFMGSWMTPSETGWLGASGNTATCSIQGFAFMAFGLGSALYQMMLSLQMMLLVTFKWTQSKFAEKVECRMHWFILILAIMLGSIPLFFQGYNPECGECRFVPLPRWCGDWFYGDGTTECIRGNPIMSDIYLFIMLSIAAVATFFCTVAMLVIYRTVYNQEKRNARHSFVGDNNNEANHSQSKRIRKTMLLYTGSFYMCWILPLVFLNAPNAPAALRIIGNAITPLMGFLNMLVFIQPKCVKYQKDNEGTGLMNAYSHVILSAPIRVASRVRASMTWTAAGFDIPDDIDDGIGFGSYNDHVDVAEGEAVTARVSVTAESQIAQQITETNSAESVYAAESETEAAQLRG